ncbi:DUF998 domain-containing protein [Streptosporangium sp. NPDC023615]|uniref:DUF998 domain-containing protein n=1 Tax=Streptosporangium sp. NPDC023615 TaxID=3154794 RepID=UPI003426C30C
MSKIGYVCGLAAGPLFVLSVLVQGAVRDGYDPLRHPVSSLALGEHGWVQSATFIVAGVLTCVFASMLPAGLRDGPGRRWGPVLIAGWALGLIGAGLSSLAFAQNPTVVDFGGLFQRLMIIVGWVWLTLLVHDQRHAAGSSPGGASVAEPAKPAEPA